MISAEESDQAEIERRELSQRWGASPLTYRENSPASAHPVGGAVRRSACSALTSRDSSAIRRDVDVMLERELPAKRLWIEFEVSRALTQSQITRSLQLPTSSSLNRQPTISWRWSVLMSARGRRNLACTTIALMRQIGMRAFQTVLLPGTDPAEVKRLNHLNQADLDQAVLPVEIEIERAITVTESLISMSNVDVHFVGDLLVVFLNLHRWNADLVTPEGKQTWGSRTVTYFVYEVESGLFAPSKFCASPHFSAGSDWYRLQFTRGNDSSWLLDVERRYACTRWTRSRPSSREPAWHDHSRRGK